MIIETCPQCGADLQHMVYATNPPIPAWYCPKCQWRYEERPRVTREPFKAKVNDLTNSLTGIFDQEEIIEGCTVQVLRNSVTGETSVGWWRGTAEDMPKFKKE